MNLSQEQMISRGFLEIQRSIRTIENFPKQGISFKDITPLFAQPQLFAELVSRMAHEVAQSGAQKVVGLEARGFILGIAIAQHLGLPFVPARKAGKLPGEVISQAYSLEYGKQVLELQRDSITKHDKVAVVDDLLATGGTAHAAGKLIQQLGGTVSGYFFVIELSSLAGRSQFPDQNVNSIFTY